MRHARSGHHRLMRVPSDPDWQAVHVHPRAPDKPAEGQACNGCGLCCLVAPCPLGMLLSLRRRGACEALVWDEADDRYHCGALQGPGWWASLARRWIAAGIGCDARFTVEHEVAVDTAPRP
jgi:hypothetical protein